MKVTGLAGGQPRCVGRSRKKSCEFLIPSGSEGCELRADSRGAALPTELTHTDTDVGFGPRIGGLGPQCYSVTAVEPRAC